MNTCCNSLWKHSLICSGKAWYTYILRMARRRICWWRCLSPLQSLQPNTSARHIVPQLQFGTLAPSGILVTCLTFQVYKTWEPWYIPESFQSKRFGSPLEDMGTFAVCDMILLMTVRACYVTFHLFETGSKKKLRHPRHRLFCSSAKWYNDCLCPRLQASNKTPGQTWCANLFRQFRS